MCTNVPSSENNFNSISSASVFESLGLMPIIFSQFIVDVSQHVSAKVNSGGCVKSTLQSSEPKFSLQLHLTGNIKEKFNLNIKISY